MFDYCMYQDSDVAVYKYLTEKFGPLKYRKSPDGWEDDCYLFPDGRIATRWMLIEMLQQKNGERK